MTQTKSYTKRARQNGKVGGGKRQKDIPEDETQQPALPPASFNFHKTIQRLARSCRWRREAPRGGGKRMCCKEKREGKIQRHRTQDGSSRPLARHQLAHRNPFKIPRIIEKRLRGKKSLVKGEKTQKEKKEEQTGRRITTDPVSLRASLLPSSTTDTFTVESPRWNEKEEISVHSAARRETRRGMGKAKNEGPIHF